MGSERNGVSVILVVDDDELVLKTLRILVSSMGYHCLSAPSAVEAVEILKKTKCDLVLSDLSMPDMDGMELLQHIIRHHTDTDVIIATGYSERTSYADVIRAGALDFIKKPIDQAELEAKLARALRERQMIRQLEALSMSDGLTSLLNRRAFDLRFPREVERAFRQSYPLYLGIVDIDNFKGYNDTHGHDAGDQVRISLANIMNDCTRNSVDLTFRFGGDEFAVVLCQTTGTQTAEIVQRIQLSFIESDFDGLTLSIGVVSCRRNDKLNLDDDIMQMQKRADLAMYDAKNSGKNCVVTRFE